MAGKFSVTFLFSYTSDLGFQGGFSETYMAYKDNYEDALAASTSLASKRLALLGPQIKMVGRRFKNLFDDNNSPTQQVLSNSPGTAADCDTPWQALRVRVRSSPGNYEKNLILHCLSDAYIIKGAYTNTTTSSEPLRRFMDELKQNWRWYGKDKTIAKVKIVSIATSGTVTTLSLEKPLAALEDPGAVRLLNCKDVDGNLVSGIYANDSVASDKKSTHIVWPNGVVSHSGQATVESVVAHGFDSYFGAGVTIKKIGAPFFLYHGRLKRRKTKPA